LWVGQLGRCGWPSTQSNILLRRFVTMNLILLNVLGVVAVLGVVWLVTR